jgi:hypothetical protein
MGNKRHATVFSSVYSRGGIPCRLDHGSVKHKIHWNVDITRMDYNPVLITFVEGLRENQHPFKHIVENGLLEMFRADNASEKIIALLPNMSNPLRNALAQQNKVSIANQEMLIISLKVFKELIVLVGPNIEPLLVALLPPIASKVLTNDYAIRELVQEVLTELQICGGPKCLETIRKRIPTYTPQMF